MAASAARDLRPLFDPRSVAIVGASNDPAKWGQWFARGGLRGEHRRAVYLVNRSGEPVLGRQTYLSLADLPDEPELVVVAVPASAFEETVDAAIEARARAIVAIAAGLGEIGEERQRRERAVVERVRAGGAVLVRPNCMGVFDAGAELDLATTTSRRVDRARLAEREPRARGLAARRRRQARRIPVRLAREPGGRRGGRARRRARRARRTPVLLLAGGLSAAGVHGEIPHRRARQRLGGRRRRVPRRGDRAGLDAARARRGGATPARGEASARPVPRDRHGRGRLGRRRRRPRGPDRSRAPRAVACAARAARGGDAANRGDDEPGRLRGRGRAGPAHVRARPAPLARVGGGRRGAPDRLPRRLQRVVGQASRARDRGGARACSGRRGARESGDRPDDVLAGAPALALREAGVPVFRDVEAALGAIDRVAGHELAAPRGVPALAHAASESAVDGYFGARGLLAAAGVPFAAARRTESADESGGGRCRAWLPRRSEALGVTHKSDAGGVVVGLEDEPALRAAVATMAGPEGYAVEELVPTDTGVELIVGCRCDVRFGPVLLVGLGGMSRSPKPSSSASTPAPCRRDG